jgi:phosphatidylserine/phosphatidylglycerophosphate/cardiolipin synthase-like enzyme
VYTRGSRRRVVRITCAVSELAVIAVLAVVAPVGAIQAGVGEGSVELVESVPIETALDLADIRNAGSVWCDMIRAAERTIDIETFYVSGRTGKDSLDAVIGELGDAARRGVHIRLIVDSGFYTTYPDVAAEIGELPGSEVRVLDAESLWGGVLHAKFFIVDGSWFFVGSQNWDWRALEHIRELGVRIGDQGLAQALQAIFEMDWALATEEGARLPGEEQGTDSALSVSGGPFVLTTDDGNEVTAVLAASPAEALPPGIAWDESLLVQVIDAAREHVRLQLLTFNPVDREGTYHDALECALRRAAARGVHVRIVLSDWSTRSSMLPYALSLAAVPGIEVRFTTIPQWSGGFIPYARVEHAKYLVADDDACWIGTSNWNRSGFHQCRNVSLFLHGAAIATRVIEFFETGWNSRFAHEANPCKDYEAPRTGE